MYVPVHACILCLFCHWCVCIYRTLTICFPCLSLQIWVGYEYQYVSSPNLSLYFSFSSPILSPLSSCSRVCAVTFVYSHFPCIYWLLWSFFWIFSGFLCVGCLRYGWSYHQDVSSNLYIYIYIYIKHGMTSYPILWYICIHICTHTNIHTHTSIV